MCLLRAVSAGLRMTLGQAEKNIRQTKFFINFFNLSENKRYKDINRTFSLGFSRRKYSAAQQELWAFTDVFKNEYLRICR